MSNKRRRPYKEVRTAFRRKRLERDMSVRDAAQALGVTETCVYQWELGQHLPTGRRIVDVARLYECTADELLYDGKTGRNIRAPRFRAGSKPAEEEKE